MTLKRKDGKWNLVNIGIITGIMASIAIAFEPTLKAVEFIFSPWVQMPSNISRIEKKVDRIMLALDIQEADIKTNSVNLSKK